MLILYEEGYDLCFLFDQLVAEHVKLLGKAHEHPELESFFLVIDAFNDVLEHLELCERSILIERHIRGVEQLVLFALLPPR